MLPYYLPLFLSGLVAMQPVPSEAQISPPQQRAILVMASAGCMLTEISKNYSAAGDINEISSAVEKACDGQITDLYKFQAAHLEFTHGQPQSLEEARSGGRLLATALIKQIKGASFAMIPPPPVQPLLNEGPYGGRFEHFGSSQERETEIKMAEKYCSQSGRHEKITQEDKAKQSFAFHCFRSVTSEQMSAGDNGF
jgi:hypothetical protein